jgi:hypothetical protein
MQKSEAMQKYHFYIGGFKHRVPEFSREYNSLFNIVSQTVALPTLLTNPDKFIDRRYAPLAE